MQQRIKKCFVQEFAEDWFTITKYKSKLKKSFDFPFSLDDRIEKIGYFTKLFLSSITNFGSTRISFQFPSLIFRKITQPLPSTYASAVVEV